MLVLAGSGTKTCQEPIEIGKLTISWHYQVGPGTFTSWTCHVAVSE